MSVLLQFTSGGASDPNIWIFVQAIVGAAIYATVGFVSNRTRDGEEFDPARLAATLVVAIVVAALTIASGTQPTSDQIIYELATYAGLIAVIEKMIEGIGSKSPMPNPKSNEPSPDESGNDSDGL